MILFTVAIIAIVIVVTLLAAFFVSSEMARPIKKLNEAAKHLTDGEFDFTLTKKSNDEIGELTATFLETRKILQHQIHLLDAEAHRDGLTGVGNKSAFMDREEEINKEIADGTSDFSVAVFDVNKLKITNDVFGHLVGDKLLYTVSSHLTDFFGMENVFRIGGDEFVVILTKSQSEAREALVKQCIDKMKALSLEGISDYKISCAYGVAHFNMILDHQLSDVLRRADKEMYKNKAISKKESFPWQQGAKGLKQLQFEKYCQLVQTLTNSTDDYLFLMNAETGVIRFFGQDPSSFEIADGRHLSNGILDMLEYVHPNDYSLVKEAVSSIINHEKDAIDIVFRMLSDKNDKTMRWVNCRGNVIKDETDSHFVVIGRISQNAVNHLYNQITMLFNKTKLKMDLRSGLTKSFSCLMLLDIDNLSEINLKHGSVYGHKLLKTMAEELERRFSMWQIYHAEQDQFVILLDIDSGKKAKKIFEEIKAALSSKCSISASVVPNDRSLYLNIENIYDYAVQLLNNSKKEGTGELTLFSKESMLEQLSAVELLAELEESVERQCEGFSLIYQPQIDANDYSILSAEALLRFTSKSSGMIYPDRFIPALEQTGLIHEVGVWVIDQALQQCKNWRAFVPNFKISVNVSPKQLERKRFAAQVVQLLSKYDLPGGALILEITESAQLDENEKVFAVLEKLRQAGSQIAIDDFGTGYSNLGNLKHIHANILKIDRLFIRDIKEKGYNYNLIYNVIEFARSNSLQVCLEGVENADEFAVVSSLQPDIFQGYLFDKPCDPAVLEAKYFDAATEEYADRITRIEQLNKVKRHAPIVNMEMKTILRGINVGLWIIRINAKTGVGELYTDDTMRKLLGVEDGTTPKECYDHWRKNIRKKFQPTVNAMIENMESSDRVIQAEYQWNHPTNGVVSVRCSGRCTEKNDEVTVFEGFHRVISNL